MEDEKKERWKIRRKEGNKWIIGKEQTSTLACSDA